MIRPLFSFKFNVLVYIESKLEIRKNAIFSQFETLAWGVGLSELAKTLGPLKHR